MEAIVAVDDNWGIGYQNKLLFHIKDDMKNFRRITKETGVVLMGRKTLESIGKLLPNRLNIVLSTSEIDRDKYSENINNGTKLIVFSDIKSVLQYIADNNLYHRTCVIGGSSIYEQFLPYCTSVTVTRVYKKYDKVDAYFPNLDESEDWELSRKTSTKIDNKLFYTFDQYINLNRKTNIGEE